MSYPTGQLLMASVAEDQSLPAALRISLTRKNTHSPGGNGIETLHYSAQVSERCTDNLSSPQRSRLPRFHTASRTSDPRGSQFYLLSSLRKSGMEAGVAVRVAFRKHSQCLTAAHDFHRRNAILT